MDIEKLRNIINYFDQNAFQSFFHEVVTFSDDGIKIPERISDNIWASQAERFFQSEEVFFLSYCPFQILNNFSVKNLDLNSIKNSMLYYEENKSISPWLPISGKTYYIINNFDSSKLNINDDKLIEYYETEFNNLLPFSTPNIGVGNINTFFTAAENNIQKLNLIFEKFIKKYREGICISISPYQISTYEFLTQTELSGVTKESQYILQPTIKLPCYNTVLTEFNRIINSEAHENELEDFLKEYYQELFGYKYDRIETQLWLKFPDSDIGGRERRMDIFMRNAVENDWELFELKRADANLVKSVSGIPMFTEIVHKAISQAKNYQKILNQDNVKRKFAAEGIEYYEPELNIVVGKKPSISQQQWRRIVTENSNGIKILTYDTILSEAAYRLKLY